MLSSAQPSSAKRTCRGALEALLHEEDVRRHLEGRQAGGHVGTQRLRLLPLALAGGGAAGRQVHGGGHHLGAREWVGVGTGWGQVEASTL